MLRVPRPSVPRVVLLGLVAPIAVAGCGAPVIVDAAPYAADPDCARVMLAVPDVVGGLDYRETSSQATASWGDDFPLIMRCGVEPPGPTIEPCVTLESGGNSVDWLVIDEGERWLAITFGRSPAVELAVPKERAQEALGDVLAEVSGAAALAPLNGLECR